MKHVLTALFIIVISVMNFAQDDELIMSGGDPVDPYRYRDVKGSPFLLESVVIADLLRNDGTIVRDVAIRYNGYTQQFEVPQGSSDFIELDKSWYLRMEILAEKNPGLADQFPGDELILQRGIHNRFDDEFVILLFNGDGVFLIKQFIVDMKKVTIQDVGRRREFKRFNPKAYYYLKDDGKLTQLKLKRKDVIKEFDNPQVEAFISDENIKCNSEEDLIRITAHYSSLKSQTP